MNVTRQRGAVLVTSMLMLLVLTIIGVTVMQMSRMQERMAGNTRDMNLAFQGAEAALRAGEQMILSQVTQPTPCATAGCEVWVLDPIRQVETEDMEWWETNSLTVGTDDAKELDTLSAAPMYVTEELGFVRTDGGVEAGLEVPVGRDFYRVTARSTGGSGEADTVLQSTYTRKY